jgi:hypothetical protein
MGQITIYLNEEVERKMRAFVKSLGLSQSKWVAGLIEEKLENEWPESVLALAGAWEDFPTIEEIRRDIGDDIKREPI